LRIGISNGGHEIGRRTGFRVVLVDPIPGEVPEGVRGDSRARRCDDCERRNIGNDEPRARFDERPGLVIRLSGEAAMKLCGPPDRFRCIEAEAVRLDDARIGFD
jgi:hypothetical protein